MAKLTCLLALFVAVVVCAEAIRIDPPQPSYPTGRYFPNVKKSDPQCKGRENGLYPVDGDCTRYIKCVDGDRQEGKCPEDFKFDSFKNCVPPGDNPDCGNKRSSGPLNEDEKCPDTYGIFPVQSDCHKFKTCSDGTATIHECPKHQVYSDTNGSCIDGDKCPDPQSVGTVCKRANQMLPDKKNCRRYIKCVNFEPQRKECPPGTAFDPTKDKDKKPWCTKEQLDKCKNNSIHSVGQDDE